MKKTLLLLVAMFAMMQFGVKANVTIDPSEYFSWSYGLTSPGTAVGEGNTMNSLQYIFGTVKTGKKVAIPGTASTQEIAIMNPQTGVYETKELYLMNSSKEKVLIGGPSTNLTSGITAIYPKNAWPEEFTNGAQPCTMIRFGTYNKVSTPGKYTVVFPEGSLYFDGEPCEEFEVVFEVKDTRNYKVTNLPFEVNPTTGIPLSQLLWPTVSLPALDDNDRETYRPVGINPDLKAKFWKEGDETNAQYYEMFAGGGTLTKVTWEVQIINPPYTCKLNENGSMSNVIIEPGTYHLEIPQGILRIENMETDEYVTNQALSYTFIVEDSSNPPVNPPAGDKFDELPGITPKPGDVTTFQSIQLATPEGYNMYLPETIVPFTLTLADGTTQNVTPRQGLAGEYIFVDFAAPFTSKGEYKLTIPEGGIVYYQSVEGTVIDWNKPLATAEKEIKYNVLWGTESDLSYRTTPENGESVYKISDLYIYFDETVIPADRIYATVQLPDETTKQYIVTYNAGYNRFYIGLYDYPNQKGEYIFTIPAGIARTADGKINKEIKVSYKFLEREVVDLGLTTDPANGSKVKELEMIKLIFPENVTAVKLLDGGTTTVNFFTPDAEKSMPRYIVESADEYSIDLREKYVASEETKGLYTVEIPEGLLICTLNDGTQVVNDNVRLSWILTEEEGSVEEIFGAETTVTVYDMQGRILLNNADADALRALEKGLYIINGVKTILK